MKVTYKHTEYEIPDAHPAANCLPWHLDRIEFSELVSSVRAGYDADKPVVVQAGTELIISGRRRALACVIAGIDPVTREVDWDDDQIQKWVRRDELIRRNLEPGERAAALVALARLNVHGTNQHEKKAEVDTSHDVSTKTISEIAKEAGTSKATIERTIAVRKNAPELLPLVAEGKLAANVAEKCAKQLTPTERKKLADADEPKRAAKQMLDKAAARKQPTVSPKFPELKADIEKCLARAVEHDLHDCAKHLQAAYDCLK